ncbi:MAG: polyprenyl synthetase family protein [Bacteroidales bacterium]|nr:polyprenyl synthetase family protein [Bacteroidales bacterium]MDD4670063.1 polyprenyl synthetase family protein [Bacteroidales bacterium]
MYDRIKDFLGEDWLAYRKMVESSLHAEMAMLNKINEYLFQRPGKQIRPMLSLLTAKACNSGICGSNVIRCAAASEMLHTATLLHDDVADNSDTRRGAPTVMSVVSPTASVLIGDFWLSKVIELIVTHCDNRIILCFSKCLKDLAEGEMLQLEKAETLSTTEDDYFAIIYRKTASLFETSIKSAAYAADATMETVSAFEQYAVHVGLAFQIMDDIFDYSPALSIGKPTGIDILEKKITLPLLGAFMNASSAETDDIKSQIKEAGSSPQQDRKIVDNTFDFVNRHNGIDYAKSRLSREIAIAVDSLADIMPSDAKTYLTELARYMSRRLN